MYVDLLSAALAGEDGAPTTQEGLSYAAVVCRARMLNSRGERGHSAQWKLACEVDYDRALINLCTASGVDADPTRFAQPEGERSRLELALAEAGHDLAGTGALGVRPPG
jgi:hypothetical protein